MNKLNNREKFENNLEDINLVSGMVVHTADISGAAKEWTLEMKWARLISQEFTEQGIAETTLNVNLIR